MEQEKNHSVVKHNCSKQLYLRKNRIKSARTKRVWRVVTKPLVLMTHVATAATALMLLQAIATDDADLYHELAPSFASVDVYFVHGGLRFPPEEPTLRGLANASVYAPCIAYGDAGKRLTPDQFVDTLLAGERTLGDRTFHPPCRIMCRMMRRFIIRA